MVIQDYSFILNKRQEKKAYWNCSHAKSKKCRARAITDAINYSNCKMTGKAHNHPTDVKQEKMYKTLKEIKGIKMY